MENHGNGGLVNKNVPLSPIDVPFRALSGIVDRDSVKRAISPVQQRVAKVATQRLPS